MSTETDLDDLQTICDAGDLAALRRVVPTLVVELREARAKLVKLPNHCGDEVCQRPVSPGSRLCGCACTRCTAAETLGTFAHEAST